MAKIIFWYDVRSYTMMDTTASYFGLDPVIIDPEGFLKRRPEVFDSLDDALVVYPDHKLVWVCPKGKILLDKFEHPGGDAIYAFGHNVDGMSPDFTTISRGTTIRLRNPEIIWDHMAAQIVLYDRLLYFNGRRRM